MINLSKVLKLELLILIFIFLGGFFVSQEINKVHAAPPCPSNLDSCQQNWLGDYCYKCPSPKDRQVCNIDAGATEIYICDNKQNSESKKKWEYLRAECTTDCADNARATPFDHDSCKNIKIEGYANKDRTGTPIGKIYEDSYLNISFNVKEEDKDKEFKMEDLTSSPPYISLHQKASNGTVTFITGNDPKSYEGYFKKKGEHRIRITLTTAIGIYCEFSYQVEPVGKDEAWWNDRRMETAFRNCYLRPEKQSNTIKIKGYNIPSQLIRIFGGIPYPGLYTFKLRVPGEKDPYFFPSIIFGVPNSFKVTGENNTNFGSHEEIINKTLIPNQANQQYEIVLSLWKMPPFNPLDPLEDTPCRDFFRIDKDGNIEVSPTPKPGTPPGNRDPSAVNRKKICESAQGDCTIINSARCLCETCIEKGSMWTALGCIKTDISGFVESFFKIGLGVAGGIALLFIIYGGFLIMTSGGSEEAVKQGKDILTSAITGLLLIIFSVLLLQLISVDILKIPGFNKEPEITNTPPVITPTPSITPILTITPILYTPTPSIFITPTPYGMSTPTPTFTPTPSPTLQPECIQKTVYGGCNPNNNPCPDDKPICTELSRNPDNSSIIRCCPN